MEHLEDIDFSIIASFIMGVFITLFIVGAIYIKINAPDSITVTPTTIRISAEIAEDW